MYQSALRKAEEFHDQLALDSHPNTYAHYGSDRHQVAFGSVHWITSSYLQSDGYAELMNLPPSDWSLDGETTLVIGGKKIQFDLANRPSPTSDEDPDSGDGTVPNSSGAAIMKANGTQRVFRMKGFDHQGSYANRDVLDNVMYCIGQIIQQAVPAKELATKVEGGHFPCS